MQNVVLTPQPAVGGVRDIRRQLRGVTVEQIQQRVDSFYSGLPESLTDSELRDEVYKIVLPGESRSITFAKAGVSVPVGTNFFRGRKIDDLGAQLRTTSDVWEPRPEFVRSTGRLNDTGQPILYTSIGTPTTAVHECRFEVGDCFAMSRFIAKESFDSTVVGQDPLAPGLDDEDRQKLGVIQSFLDRAFSAKADTANPDPYRLSRFLALEFWDLPPQLYRGWAFRSVVDPTSLGWNFSFRPGVGRKTLRYKETHVYRLLGFAADHQPQTELLAAFEPSRGESLARLSPNRFELVSPFWP